MALLSLGNIPAAQIATPTIDPAGAAIDTRSALLKQQGEQMQQVAQKMEMLASGAAYAMPNGLDGPVDEKKWNEVLDSYEASGMPQDQMEKLRSRPDLAPVLLKGSAQALAAAHDAQLFPLKLKDLEASIQEHLASADATTLALERAKHPLPVATNPNDVMRDPMTGQIVPGGGGDGGIQGTSVEQQAYKILRDGDPSTAEYAQAFSALSQPTISMQPDGKGGMVQVVTPRSLPQGTRPPTFAGQAAQTQAPPAGPAPPSGTGPSDGGLAPSVMANGTTVTPIPGLQGQQTEAQVRSGVLSETLNSVAPTILKNFDVLADPTGQALGLAGPIGNIFQTPEYQQASAAMSSALQTIVFQLSGANTGTNEMLNTAKSMTPAIGDKPETIAFKRGLFISYVKSIAEASKDPEKKAAAQKMLDLATAPDATPKNADETKKIDGKNYYRIGSDWYEAN